MARFQRGDETREAVDIDAQLALLDDGFARVPRGIDDTGEPRDPDLERAIHDNPDDDQAWLVYADLLIERGHPRGPIVALESAPVKNIVQRAEREAETRRMRHAATDVLLGSLAGRAGLSLKWNRGFIHSAKLHGTFADDAAEALLVDLLAHPSARFLRALELSCVREDYRLLLALILNAPAPPPLRKLWMWIEHDDAEHPVLGDVGALGAVYPQLDQVRLDGTHLQLAGLALPRATYFELDTFAMTATTARALAAAPWPALRVLDFDLHGSTLALTDLAWVLELPRLQKLYLYNTTFRNELVEALVRHPIATQIEVLGLRGDRLDDRSVELLVQARDRFPTPFRLEANLSSEAREMLAEANIDFERWWW